MIGTFIVYLTKMNLKLTLVMKRIIILILILFPIFAESQVSADFTVNQSDLSYCVGDTVVFTNTSTGNYVVSYWAFGDGTDTWKESPYHIYSLSGTYTVSLTVTDTSGNSDTHNLAITVNEVPNVSILQNNIAQSLTAQVNQDNITFAWLFDGDTTNQTDSVVYYLESGVYTVIATNQSGCFDTSSINISLSNSSETNDTLQIIVRNNILTPDLQDGANDVLFIEGLSNFSSPCIVSVYNKWGQLVYYNADYSNLNGFTGKDNHGKNLDAGTYYYTIMSNGRKSTTGYVDLIR
jgi:gliding motility-associated-like protein